MGILMTVLGLQLLFAICPLLLIRKDKEFIKKYRILIYLYLGGVLFIIIGEIYAHSL